MHASLPRGQWVPDTSVTACEKCTKKFGQYRRKHHCRNCGHVFCWECSGLKYELLVPAKNGGHKKEPERLRVCDPCYDTLQDIGTPASALDVAPRVSTIDAQRLDEREARIAAANAEAQAEEWCAAEGRRLEAPQRLPEAGWRTAREKSYFVARNEAKVEVMLSVLTLPNRTGLHVKSKSSTTHFRSFLTELRHPFIASVVDVSFGQPSADLLCGQLFVLRQFAAAGSLRDRIHGKANPKHGCRKKYAKPGKPLREDKCAVLGKQIIEGLQYLSTIGKDLGELHMCAGLRASDVLLASSNRACITDFENDLIRLEAKPDGGSYAHVGPHAASLHAFSHIFFEMSTGRELDASVFADPLAHIPVTAPGNVQQVLRELLQPEHGRKSTGEPLSLTRVMGMKLFSSVVYEKEVSAAIFGIPSELTKKQRKRLRRVFCAAEDKAKKAKRQERQAQREVGADVEREEQRGLAEPEPEPEPEPEQVPTDGSLPAAFELPASIAEITTEINMMSTDVFALVVEAAKSSMDGGSQAMAAQAALPAIGLRFQEAGLDPALAATIHVGMRSLLRLVSDRIELILQEPDFEIEQGQDGIQVKLCELLCPLGLLERHVVSIAEALDDGDDESDDDDNDEVDDGRSNAPGELQPKQTATDLFASNSSDSGSDTTKVRDGSNSKKDGSSAAASEPEPEPELALEPEPEPEPEALDPIAEMQLRFLKQKTALDCQESAQQAMVTEFMRNSQSQPEAEAEPEPALEPEPELASGLEVSRESDGASEGAPPGPTATRPVPEGSPPAKTDTDKNKRTKKKKKKKKRKSADTPKPQPAAKISDLFGSSSDDEQVAEKAPKKKAANLFGSSSDDD
jgi:hypothetical protein